MMMNKKELENQIETWEGVNKYIVDKLKQELALFKQTEEQPKNKEYDLDLNNDGVVDKQDAKIASKVMHAVRYKKSKKK